MPDTDVLETMPFGSLEIVFDPNVLRPRPWTQAQSAWVAELLADAPEGDVLELCTGAGQIGLLAVRGTGRRLVAVDADVRAVELAWDNAERAGLTELVDIRHGEMGRVIDQDERFPVAIADPPWVPTAEVDRLPEDPPNAIDGGDDGLGVARECLETLDAHLLPDGIAIIQLGSVEQVDLLAVWAHENTRLVLGEVRTFEDGVLVRADRAL